MPDTDSKDAVDKCRIDFRGGRFLVVTDAGINGKVDRIRAPVYRDFIRALHERLADAPEGDIHFTVGVSQTYRNAMLALGVIALLLFVVAPAVLVVDFHEWRAIGPLTAGATFIWPFWKKIGTNPPHAYDPHHPPGDLMDSEYTRTALRRVALGRPSRICSTILAQNGVDHVGGLE